MLEISELTMTYGKHMALDHLSMTIGDGQLHGFVGPNGAGKTTTMRILATLLRPVSGSAVMDGVSILREPAKARRLIGYMPDFFGVYGNLKVWEYLDFYARCHGLDRDMRSRMTGQLLELVQLTDKRDAYVDTLSRGMKQRLCLAHALIHDPHLLILDEPASGMDPRARADMKSILRSLKDMGKTVFISSHILPELSEMCDSLTIIDHGHLIFSGSVQALSDKMNGNAPVEIRFLPGTDEQGLQDAATLLRELPFVKQVQSPESLLLQVQLDGGEQEVHEMLSRLVLGGLPVCDLHRAPMNLEKVFMEVTRHD